jgi:hypothetical protein
MIVRARVLKNSLPLHAVAAIAYPEAVDWKQENLDGHEAITWTDTYDIEYGINKEAERMTQHMAAIIRNDDTITILDGKAAGEDDESLAVGINTWRKALSCIKMSKAITTAFPGETAPATLVRTFFTIGDKPYSIFAPPNWRLEGHDGRIQFYEPGRSDAVMMVRMVDDKIRLSDSRDPLSYHIYERAFTMYHSTIINTDGQALELASAKFAPTLNDVDAFADIWPRIVASLRAERASR